MLAARIGIEHVIRQDDGNLMGSNRGHGRQRQVWPTPHRPAAQRGQQPGARAPSGRALKHVQQFGPIRRRWQPCQVLFSSLVEIHG
jgi:hypothetical protein